MALVRQIVGCSQTCRTSADDCGLFAGSRILSYSLLPLTCIIDTGSSLELADRDGGAQLLMFALGFAGVSTDTAKDLGERHALADDRGGLFVFAVLDMADESRNIDVGRASGAAGNDIVGLLAVLLHDLHLIHDRAGGTYLDTRSAEAAAGFLQRLAVGNACTDARICLNVIENLYASQILTCPDTASAADAACEQMLNERVGIVVGHTARFFAPALRAHAHVLIHGLKLALSVLGAAGAVSRMCCQDQFHRHSAHLVGLRSVDADSHALTRHGRTGRQRFVLSLDLNDTKTAAALGFQIGMAAKVRDKDPGLQRGVQDALTLAGFDLPVVDIKFHWLLLIFQL